MGLGISAHNDHFLISKRTVEFLLVFVKFVPFIEFYPERVAADPQSVVATRQCVIELRPPPAGYPLQLEFITTEIPLVAREQFYIASIEILVEFRNAVPQRL